MLEQFIYSFRAPIAFLFDAGFLYAILQLGVFLAFAVTAARAWRVSSSRLVELLTAVVFGLLLEEGDIIIFGTYSYDRHWFAIGYVPIAIGLTWAMIIASAMNLTDTMGLPSIETLPKPRSRVGFVRWLALGCVSPIADALWAIILDLALDAVAIRLKLWTWRIPLDQGWFGVPWGNFYSWLFVAAMFSFFTRLVRRRVGERGPGEGLWQLAVPFAAYAGLLASFVPFVAVQLTILSGDRQNTAPLFFAALAAFIAVTIYGATISRRAPRERSDRWLMSVRTAIHLIFLGALFLTGIFMQLPQLLWVAIAMLAIEIIVTTTLKRSLWTAPVSERISSGGESQAE